MTAVPDSVMPKGVEHNLCGIITLFVTLVPDSVMPKGVEHICLPFSSALNNCAGFSDAERR